MSVCDELNKTIEQLSVKIMEAQMSKGVDPKVVKQELEQLLTLAKDVLEKAGCPVDLSRLKAMVEETEGDAKELEEAKKAVEEVKKKEEEKTS